MTTTKLADFAPGSYFQDEVLTLTGNIRLVHFYRCQILVKGPAVLVDCVFGDMEPDSIECVGDGIQFVGCAIAGTITDEEYWETIDKNTEDDDDANA